MLNIATPAADHRVKNLSGGNQQKAILARWLAINPQDVKGCYILLSVESKKPRTYINYLIDISDR